MDLVVLMLEVGGAKIRGALLNYWKYSTWLPYRAISSASFYPSKSAFSLNPLGWVGWGVGTVQTFIGKVTRVPGPILVDTVWSQCWVTPQLPIEPPCYMCKLFSNKFALLDSNPPLSVSISISMATASHSRENLKNATNHKGKYDTQLICSFAKHRFNLSF